MHDDYLTPIWAERHDTVSAFLGDLINQTRVAFERLAARTYDAPWRRIEPASVRCAATARARARS